MKKVELQQGLVEALNLDGTTIDKKKIEYLSVISEKDGRLSKRKDYYVPGSEAGDLYFSGDQTKSYKSLLIVPVYLKKVFVEYEALPDGRPDKKKYVLTHYDTNILKTATKNAANKNQLQNGNVLDGQIKLQVKIVFDEKNPDEENIKSAVITLKGMDFVFKDAGAFTLNALLKGIPQDSLFTKLIRVEGEIKDIEGRDGTSKTFIFKDGGNLSDNKKLLKHVDLFKETYETFHALDSKEDTKED